MNSQVHWVFAFLRPLLRLGSKPLYSLFPSIPYPSISRPPSLFYFFLAPFLVTQECAVRIDLRDDSIQFFALGGNSIHKLLLKSLVWRKSHCFHSDLPPPLSACGRNIEILDRCSVHSYLSLSPCFCLWGFSHCPVPFTMATRRYRSREVLLSSAEPPVM